MSRRRAAGTLASAVLVGVLAAGAPVPAGAQAGGEIGVGWWTRSPAQSAPAGGFAVASAPDGPVTVAAIVLGSGGEITAGTLSAVETDGVAAPNASIVVCPAAASATVPEEPGASLDDAPEADCAAGSVPFERDADSLRWTADLTGLLAGVTESASLVLVPGPSEGPLAPTFDVRFAAPTVDLDLVPEATDAGFGGEDAAATAGGTGSNPAPTSSPAPVPPGPVATAPASSPGTSSSGAAPSTPPAEADGAAAPDADVDVSEELVAAPTGTPLVSSGGGGGRDLGKGLTYVAISALVGAAVAAGSRMSRLRGLT